MPDEPGDFSSLGTPEPIVRALRTLGITVPTPVQAATLPDAFAGADVLSQAPTGSGKTLAFGIPLVARLLDSGAARVGKPHGLIIAPTRELADQIADVLADVGTAAGLRVLSFVGGDSVRSQRTQLASPVDIAVVTPGRAHDLRRRGLLDFSEVRAVVIDEADTLAELGFLPDVRGLLRACPRQAQRLVFSATLNDDAAALIRDRRQVAAPVASHRLSQSRVSLDRVEHVELRVSDNAAADEVIAWIASRQSQCVIFANSKARVVQLAKFLSFYDISLGFLHGDRGQATRRSVLAAFANGELNVLIATDIAARGIDIDSLDLVVHADLPSDPATYVHRSGRTARAGASGQVAVVVRDREVEAAQALFEQVGAQVTTLRAGPGLPKFIKATGARRPRRSREALRAQGPKKPQSRGGRVHRPKRTKRKKS